MRKAFKMKFSLLPYSHFTDRITEAQGMSPVPLVLHIRDSIPQQKLESKWPQRTLKGLRYTWAGKTEASNKESHKCRCILGHFAAGQTSKVRQAEGQQLRLSITPKQESLLWGCREKQVVKMQMLRFPCVMFLRGLCSSLIFLFHNVVSYKLENEQLSQPLCAPNTPRDFQIKIIQLLVTGSGRRLGLSAQTLLNQLHSLEGGHI